MASIDSIFSGPIPGQSLTQDPATRGPWEMPPKFLSVNSAMDHLFNVVTSKAFIKNLQVILEDDKRTYIDEVAAGMLDDGFLNGLWTVDIMVQLAEPLIILLVWAAAQLDYSVTFSSDTGYEDRTGYENIEELLLDVGEPQVSPETALEGAIPQSPLTQGAPMEAQGAPMAPTPQLTPQGGM